MIVEGSTVYAMSPKHAPVAQAKSGDVLTFVTKDCFNNHFENGACTMEALDWDSINPATGPVYVEDACPGDVLAVKIREISVAKMGTMSAEPGFGVLGSLVTEGVVKRIPVEDGVAIFSDSIHIPCVPMIGVIGVAPAGAPVPCGTPDSHGGNMDNARIREGATLYLPVFVPGALLAMGDVHACMGDGEIMVTGVEIPARVTVELQVIKGITMQNPMLEDETSCYTIASHENLDQAIFTAVKTMAEIVSERLSLSLEQAGMLLSAAGNLQICQVVDPKKTVRMELSKAYLPALFEEQ